MNASPPSQASIILCVWIATDFSLTEQTNQLRAITFLWEKIVRSGHIRESDAYYYFHHHKKSLEYSLVATTMSQTQCHSVKYPALCSSLQASEIPKIYKETLWPLPYLSLASLMSPYSVHKVNSTYMPWWIMTPEKIQQDITFETLPKPTRCSHLLALSERHCRIMILEEIWQVGRQQQGEGVEVRCRCNISHHRGRHRHCRGRVQNQAPEGGYMATMWSLRKVVRM